MTVDQIGTVVHAADLHLGAPLDSLGTRIDAAKAQRLRDLSLGAFENLIDLVCDRQASALVLAGDVYDGAQREVSAQLRFARGMGRLNDLGIPVFIAHGNHDPIVANYRPAKDLPGNVTVFGPKVVQVHDVALANGSPLHIAGISFEVEHELHNLAQRFASLPVAPERCIGVLHANLEGLSGHDPYAPCSPSDLELAPVAYWALGHVHLRTVGNFGPNRWYAYSGNLQGRSSKPAECGAKGALVVPITAVGVGEPEFVACDTVRFVRLDVDVSAAATIGDALELLETSLGAAVVGAEGRPLVARVRFTGATAAHAAISGEAAKLTELARDHLGGVLGDGELLKVEDATRPAIDRTQLLARGDLLSALLERLDALAGDDTSLVDLVRDDLDAKTLKLLNTLSGRDESVRASLLAGVEQLLLTRMADQ